MIAIDFKKNWKMILGAFLVVLAGVGMAWILSKGMVKGTGGGTGVISLTKNAAGALDANTKYDNATGDLKEGGIGNEGTHHIERDGGASHFVYLTSSAIDLQSFVGKKVEVWGQTLASKKAGWLMDVAKIQVVQ